MNAAPLTQTIKIGPITLVRVDGEPGRETYEIAHPEFTPQVFTTMSDFRRRMRAEGFSVSIVTNSEGRNVTRYSR